jgi:hypothetical protein
MRSKHRGKASLKGIENLMHGFNPRLSVGERERKVGPPGDAKETRRHDEAGEDGVKKGFKESHD